MRSVSYSNKSKSNEIANTTGRKLKLVNAENKRPDHKQNLETVNKPVTASRPGSCPVKDSSWVPSRDWHKYLSEQRPMIPSEPPSPRPKPQSLSPRMKSLIPHHHPPPTMSFTSIQDNTIRQAKLNLLKPPDELITMKLPRVNFCSGEVPEAESPPQKGPSFNDLCDDDKRRIAQLVEELARCKQEKEEDNAKILELKNKVSELKTSLKNLKSSKIQPDIKTISIFKSLQANEQAALKKQLNELNKLLVEMQVQKATSEVQIRTITERAERVTKALHVMHRENTELQVQLRMAKERLGAANQAADRMTQELCSLREHVKPQSEDKSSQSSEDFLSEKVQVKSLDVEGKVSEDQQILTELFFNKSLLKNNLNPKETIIFISPDFRNPL